MPHTIHTFATSAPCAHAFWSLSRGIVLYRKSELAIMSLMLPGKWQYWKLRAKFFPSWKTTNIYASPLISYMMPG